MPIMTAEWDNPEPGTIDQAIDSLYCGDSSPTNVEKTPNGFVATYNDEDEDDAYHTAGDLRDNGDDPADRVIVK